LISTVLNFQTLEPSDGNDLPFILYVPSYTAVALYHHKLAADLQADPQKTLASAQQWVLADYAIALGKGGELPAADRAAVVQKLAAYTGLSADFIDKANLRINPEQFRKQLLNDQRKILGRYDGRITGDDSEPASEGIEYDPSYSLYLPAYSAAINDYLRRTLKYDSDLNYELLSGRVRPWDFGRGGDGYLDVSDALRAAMLKNPHLKVLFASGHDDLATPFLATDYTVSHLDNNGKLQANITQTYYEAGHMLYHPKASLDKLKQDVTTFMQSAISGQ